MGHLPLPRDYELTPGRGDAVRGQVVEHLLLVAIQRVLLFVVLVSRLITWMVVELPGHTRRQLDVVLATANDDSQVGVEVVRSELDPAQNPDLEVEQDDQRHKVQVYQEYL